MRILILGGAGFVGSNLTRFVINQPNTKVTVVDSLDPHFKSSCDSLKEVWDRIEFVRGSITDEKFLSEIVQDQDLIFNLAGQSSHTLSIKYPLLDAEVNCVGQLKLLEAVRLFNPKATVVYGSSSTVIGKAQEEIVDENHPEKPLEIYSADKGVAEKYYRIYHKIHGLKTIVLRFANLYGPYGKPDPEFGFINYFISRSWKDKVLKVFGEGQQKRNVMYVEDACEILWQAAQHEELFGEVCFATSPYHLSVKEIAESIVSTFDRGKVEHVSWPEDRLKMEVDRVVFSSEKLRAVIGWKARYGFQEGLQKTQEIMAKETGEEILQ